MRKGLFILFFISIVSFSQKIDSNRVICNFPSSINSNHESIDSIKTSIQFAPDLVFSTTYKKPFYQSGLSLFINYEKVEKSGIEWGFRASLRSGLTTQGGLAYLSDPQIKSFLTQPLKDSIYGQLTSLYLDVIGNFYLNYKNFYLSSGIDHPFSDFSKRSLFGSTGGIVSPNINMGLKFSKSISYNLRQDILREKIINHYEPKGNVTHSFTYNHKGKSRFKMRLFETVVYQIKDTLYNRGFEVEYLNPFLFFRPQEYNMGSADNILLGTEFEFIFGKENHNKSRLYGQVLIDDFLLSAFRARNGWWANKYGFKIGYNYSFIKLDSIQSISSNSYNIEFTFMRPYVYSQTNPGIVYGNQGLPITHPLGSNFAELYQHYSLEPCNSNFSFRTFLQSYIKGVDSVQLNSVSYGGDIYRSYIKRPYEYNNKVGQGITLRTVQLGLGFYYSLNTNKKYATKKHLQTLSLFVEPRYRLMFFENHRQADFFFAVGIQSHMWRNKDRLDY